MLLSFYRRFSRKTNVPIAVLTAYTEKEYEPFDSYSRYCPAMPVSVCFFDTALCTPGKNPRRFYLIIKLMTACFNNIFRSILKAQKKPAKAPCLFP